MKAFLVLNQRMAGQLVDEILKNTDVKFSLITGITDITSITSKKSITSITSSRSEPKISGQFVNEILQIQM